MRQPFASSLVALWALWTCVCLSRVRADESLGFEAGTGVSNLSTSPVSAGLSSHTGPLAGAFFDYTLFGGIHLETEVRYLEKGFANGPFNETAHYLGIPVVFKARMPLDLPFTPYLLVGPDVAFLLDTTQPSYGSAIPLNSTDFALDFGAGADFDLGEALKGLVQFRFSLGLANVIDTANSPVSSLTGKWYDFQVSVGTEFSL